MQNVWMAPRQATTSGQATASIPSQSLLFHRSVEEPRDAVLVDGGQNREVQLGEDLWQEEHAERHHGHEHQRKEHADRHREAVQRRYVKIVVEQPQEDETEELNHRVPVDHRSPDEPSPTAATPITHPTVQPKKIKSRRMKKSDFPRKLFFIFTCVFLVFLRINDHKISQKNRLRK